MRIVVVAPHPDDETLGAGGYLLKQKDNKNEIYWLIVTDMKEEYGYSKEKCTVRHEEIDLVAKAYGFKKVYNLGLKPAGLDEYSTGFIVQKISGVFKEIEPDVVILPNKWDVHTDHRIVFEAAYSCTKAFRYPSIKKILCMQICSETDYSSEINRFIPNMYVDIEGYIDEKVKIAEIYKSEISEFPFPRSEECIRALSVVNGSRAFCKAAEVFTVIKTIE